MLLDLFGDRPDRARSQVHHPARLHERAAVYASLGRRYATVLRGPTVGDFTAAALLEFHGPNRRGRCRSCSTSSHLDKLWPCPTVVFVVDRYGLEREDWDGASLPCPWCGGPARVVAERATVGDGGPSVCVPIGVCQSSVGARTRRCPLFDPQRAL